MNEVAERVASVRARVEAAVGRRGPGPPVRIVGVVKRQPLDRIRAAVAAGIVDLGENYAQELARHRAALGPVAARVRFHFIGALQRNKVKAVLGVALVHTVDRPAVLEALERRARSLGMVQNVLVEVNVGREATKAGVAPDGLPDLLAAFEAAPHVHCRGLMALPPPGGPEEARPFFRRLRALRDRFVRGPGRTPLSNVDLRELSMGTSQDFEVAIEEGATIVRLGTVLLGPRTPPQQPETPGRTAPR